MIGLLYYNASCGHQSDADEVARRGCDLLRFCFTHASLMTHCENPATTEVVSRAFSVDTQLWWQHNACLLLLLGIKQPMP